MAKTLDKHVLIVVSLLHQTNTNIIKTKTKKIMKAKDLTTQHRIMILEDVLKMLESGDINCGLCGKIEKSAFKLFRVLADANKIIHLLTLENAKAVTNVKAGETEGRYWWGYGDFYDFGNRIKFVNWMIEQEKLTNNI